MPDKRGNSQSADNSQLLAHKSSPKEGQAFKLQAPYKPTGDQPQAIAHNKTLAAQLYGEFKEMFPENAVEYFVS